MGNSFSSSTLTLPAFFKSPSKQPQEDTTTETSKKIPQRFYLPPFHFHFPLRVPNQINCEQNTQFIAQYFPQVNYGYTQWELEQYYGKYDNPYHYLQEYYTQCLNYKSSLLETISKLDQHEVLDKPIPTSIPTSNAVQIHEESPAAHISSYFIPSSACYYSLHDTYIKHESLQEPNKHKHDSLHDEVIDTSILSSTNAIFIPTPPPSIIIDQFNPSINTTIAAGIFQERQNVKTIVPFPQAKMNEQKLHEFGFKFQPTVPPTIQPLSFFITPSNNNILPSSISSSSGVQGGAHEG